jgi:hypothetical protein
MGWQKLYAYKSCLEDYIASFTTVSADMGRLCFPYVSINLLTEQWNEYLSSCSSYIYAEADQETMACEHS